MAATESTTMASMAPERTSASQISMACSPVSGWLTSRLLMSTPSASAYTGSSACSTSMKATSPPFFWASARTCRASVVLPLDSGPYTSMMRPRGTPPTPSARSRPMLPVEMASTCMAALSPSFITAPLPNCFSIWASAVASASFLAPGSVFWVAGATLLF